VCIYGCRLKRMKGVYLQRVKGVYLKVKDEEDERCVSPEVR
jgi:hypothetical protein